MSSPPGDPESLNEALVQQLLRNGCLRSPEIAAAFRSVPRHHFLPEHPLDQVYRDEAICTKWENGVALSSSSQPSMMALMLEQLELRPGQRVLEIGAGTGYNAALMSRVVGEEGWVVALDFDEDLVERARTQLAAAGCERVSVHRSDGAYGWPEAAPYDRIILTVGAWDIAPAWREQLAPRGRLVLPFSVGGLQLSLALDRQGDELVSASAHDCGFITLRGALAAPETQLSLWPGTWLSASEQAAVEDPGRLKTWLERRGEEDVLPVQVTADEVWGGLIFWLAAHVPGFFQITASGEERGKPRLPVLLESGSGESAWKTTGGVSDANGVCLLGLSIPWLERLRGARAYSVTVCSYGEAAGAAAALRQAVDSWAAAGRPGTSRLRVRAFPLDRAPEPAPDEVRIDKRWTRLLVRWVHPAPADGEVRSGKGPAGSVGPE